MISRRSMPALLVTALCAFAPAAAAAPWATVDGVALDDKPLQDAIVLVNKQLGEGRTMTPEQRKKLKSKLARDLLAEALIDGRINKERLKAGPRQLDAAMKRHKQRFNHDKGFRAYLGVTGHTEATFRASLEEEVLLEALVNKLLKKKPPTMADVKKALSDDPKQFMLPESARVRQILILKPAGADDAELERRRQRAAALYRRVASNPKGFSDVARFESEGPTQKQGGRLGKVRRGRMGEAFDRIVFRADAGSVVGPIETPTAFHIVLVEAVTGEEPARFVKPTTVATDALYARYEAATWGPLMRRLFADAKVAILDAEVTITVEDLVSLKADEHLVHEGPARQTSAASQGKRARPGGPGHDHGNKRRPPPPKKPR
jgi:parvulin-like peptidyl-prolyl isomerase